MNLDVASRAISTGVRSEIVGETVLSAPDDEYRSVLNVMLGYGLAPDAQPVASAKLELRIQPNF